MIHRLALTCTAVMLLTLPGFAATWIVGGDSEVVFSSQAPLESFDGRTQKISGHLSCDPTDLTSGIELRLLVDLVSLDTGIGMRNTHMRENHLETDVYPEATFTGGTLEDGSATELPIGHPVEVVLRGTFDLHGVTREMVIPATAALQRDGHLAVSSEFQVKLSDHEIKRPGFLVMKLADEQSVVVKLQLVPGSS